MKSIVFLAVASAALLTSAATTFSAEWLTKVDEDVFSGKSTAVMIGGSGAQLNVYLSCDGDRKNSLAVIFKADEGVVEDVDGELVLKADDAEPFRYAVRSYNHNDDYGGFLAELTPEDASKLVASIKGAKKRVIAGLQVAALEIKASNTLATTGSTKAAELFAKACELSQ
ncbi:MAG: hypothetical protein QE484_07175 [Rhizobium sp.]|nr:hypothetical protein [Rhizobium sp.]